MGFGMGKFILSTLLFLMSLGSAYALFINNHIEALTWNQTEIIEKLKNINDEKITETIGDIKDYNKKTLVSTGFLRPLLIGICGLSLLTLFTIPFIGRKAENPA